MVYPRPGCLQHHLALISSGVGVLPCASICRTQLVMWRVCVQAQKWWSGRLRTGWSGTAQQQQDWWWQRASGRWFTPPRTTCCAALPPRCPCGPVMRKPRAPAPAAESRTDPRFAPTPSHPTYSHFYAALDLTRLCLQPFVLCPTWSCRTCLQSNKPGCWRAGSALPGH